MKYLAAYCLLALGGNENPNEEDMKKFLKSINVEGNEEQIKAVVSHLKDKKLHELCTEGMTKLGSLNIGGGSGNASNEKKEVKEEDKEPTVEEESEDMELGDIFG